MAVSLTAYNTLQALGNLFPLISFLSLAADASKLALRFEELLSERKAIDVSNLRFQRIAIEGTTMAPREGYSKLNLRNPLVVTPPYDPYLLALCCFFHLACNEGGIDATACDATAAQTSATPPPTSTSPFAEMLRSKTHASEMPFISRLTPSLQATPTPPQASDIAVVEVTCDLKGLPVSPLWVARCLLATREEMRLDLAKWRFIPSFESCFQLVLVGDYADSIQGEWHMNIVEWTDSVLQALREGQEATKDTVMETLCPPFLTWFRPTAEPKAITSRLFSRFETSQRKFLSSDRIYPFLGIRALQRSTDILRGMVTGRAEEGQLVEFLEEENGKSWSLDRLPASIYAMLEMGVG